MLAISTEAAERAAEISGDPPRLLRFHSHGSGEVHEEITKKNGLIIFFFTIKLRSTNYRRSVYERGEICAGKIQLAITVDGSKISRVILIAFAGSRELVPRVA